MWKTHEVLANRVFFILKFILNYFVTCLKKLMLTNFIVVFEYILF